MNEINLEDPAFWDDPYSVYAKLRANGPICRVNPGNFFAATRFKDVALILRDHETFSSEGFRMALLPDWLDSNPIADSLVAMDPPRHQRMRRLVTAAFNTRSVFDLEAATRTTAGWLAQEMRSKSHVEFVSEFASVYAAHMIGFFIGLDSTTYDRLREWSDHIASVTTLPHAPDTSRAAAIRRSISEFKQCLARAIDARFLEPKDDMISLLLSARIEDTPLTSDELFSFCFLLVVAGLETTTNLLSSCMRHIAMSPDLKSMISNEPSKLPRFIDEVMRLESAAHMIPRLVTRDIRIHDESIPSGSVILAILASANRDEARFKSGNELDLSNDVGHIAFGHGAHHCLGSELARMQVRVALEEILATSVSFTLSDRGGVWQHSFAARGLLALHLDVLAE